MTDISLAFYGDDFTGSTDAMDALSRNGVRTALFLEPPTPQQVDETFGELDAVGIAGASRSMTPEEMDARLPPVFESLRDLDPSIVHYKVCSTFDSSPEIGSIGRAIDHGLSVFDSPIVPVVVGAPELDRYVCFGHLFADDGTGEVFRIDRHPTMRDHPVTPMEESDLRTHLGKQTEIAIGLIDLRDIETAPETLREVIDPTPASRPDIAVVDTASEDHLSTIGRLLWRESDVRSNGSSFVVGSSGVEYALTSSWPSGTDGEATEGSPLESVESIVVVSGSASPHTRRQIEWALDHGFEGVRLDTEHLVHSETANAAIEDALLRAGSVLESGESPILYTALGPDDPALETTREAAVTTDGESGSVGQRLGETQGDLLSELLERTDVDRVCVAGGDTCGWVVSALDVFALRSVTPISPGAPLCQAVSGASATPALEIALKGGQLGSEDYFGRVRDAGT